MVENRRTSFIINSSFNTIGNIAFRFFDLILGFIIVKFLPKPVLGIYYLFLVLLNYGQNFDLGIARGVQKIVPAICGRGDEEGAMMKIRSGFWFELITSSISGAVILVISCVMYGISGLDMQFLISGIMLGLVFVLQQVFKYQIFFYMAINRFKSVSILNIAFSFSKFIFVVLLLFHFGLIGILIGMVIANLITSGSFLLKDKKYYLFLFDWKTIKEEIMNGLPLTMLTLLYGAFFNLGTVIASFFGLDTTADFGFGFTIAGLIALLQHSIGHVQFTKMLEDAGRNIDPEQKQKLIIEDLTENPLHIAYLMLLITGLLNVSIPFIIFHFFPEFNNIIFTFPFLSIGAFYFSVVGYFNFLVMQNRYKVLFSLTILFMIMYGFSIPALQLFFEPLWALCISFFVLCLLFIFFQMLYALKVAKGDKKQLIFHASLLNVAAFYCLVVSQIINMTFPINGVPTKDLLWLFLGCLLFIALFSPFLAKAIRYFSLFALFRHILGKFKVLFLRKSAKSK